MLGRRGVGGAGVLGAARRFRRATLPIAGPRQRSRVDAADADARKMLHGDRRLFQKAQRNPSCGEFLLGLVDVARRKGCVARDQIGSAAFTDVEHLARQQATLNPPFVQIVQAARVLGRAHHQLGCLGEFLFAAEQLDIAEQVAGIAMQLARNRIEQGARVGRLLVSGNARFRQGHLIGAQPLGGAQCGLVLAAIEQ